MQKFFVNYDIALKQSPTGFHATLTTQTYGGQSWEFSAHTAASALAQARGKAAEDWMLGTVDNFLSRVHPALESSPICFWLARAAGMMVKVFENMQSSHIFDSLLWKRK